MGGNVLDFNKLGSHGVDEVERAGDLVAQHQRAHTTCTVDHTVSVGRAMLKVKQF